jgi:aminobenzoyl-glutamate utilization protein B
MAGTALDALTDPELVAAAKADLARRTAAAPYRSPLPDDTEPPFFMGAGG